LAWQKNQLLREQRKNQNIPHGLSAAVLNAVANAAIWVISGCVGFVSGKWQVAERYPALKKRHGKGLVPAKRGYQTFTQPFL